MALLYDKFDLLNDKYETIWKFYDNEIIDKDANLLIFD